MADPNTKDFISPMPEPWHSLRLVVDADILVGELLRQRGRDLIANPRLQLSITARAWDEMEHELPARIRAYVQRAENETRSEDEMFGSARDFVRACVTQVEESVYAEYEAQARAHIPHDPDHWPTVALALGLGIWSEDRHFFGYGLPSWRTDALRAYLAYMDADAEIRSDPDQG